MMEPQWLRVSLLRTAHLKVQSHPALPAFSNADESVGFISNEKDIGVAT